MVPSDYSLLLEDERRQSTKLSSWGGASERESPVTPFCGAELCARAKKMPEIQALSFAAVFVVHGSFA
jgi:hypothetical protein